VQSANSAAVSYCCCIESAVCQLERHVHESKGVVVLFAVDMFARAQEKEEANNDEVNHRR